MADNRSRLKTSTRGSVSTLDRFCVPPKTILASSLIPHRKIQTATSTDETAPIRKGSVTKVDLCFARTPKKYPQNQLRSDFAFLASLLGSNEASVLVTADTDKLDWSNRKLDKFPEFNSKSQIRVLNLNNNCIASLSTLCHLQDLVYLDLKSNFLVSVDGVCKLGNLRVLLLGSNRLTCIQSLQDLRQLEVLEVQSNQITDISFVNSMSSLQFLNLEDNLLVKIPALFGLDNLIELNLKKNMICSVDAGISLLQLKRLFLDSNRFETFESLEFISNLTSISEIVLHCNKVTLNLTFRSLMIGKNKNLSFLNGRRVLEEERRLALRNIRKLSKPTEVNAVDDLKPRTSYIESSGSRLEIFGSAVCMIPNVISGVTTITFTSTPLSETLNTISKIIQSDWIKNLVFTDVKFNTLRDIHPISAIRHLDSLVFARDIPISKAPVFRSYCLNIMPSSLKLFNGTVVTELERCKSQRQFIHYNMDTTLNDSLLDLKSEEIEYAMQKELTEAEEIKNIKELFECELNEWVASMYKEYVAE